jgi:glyoxylase-like metal-dependent hydrolase (beta-lactamase superfamily II)
MTVSQYISPLRIGSLSVQPVSDGDLWLDPSSIFKDASPEEWEPYVERDAQGQIHLGLTCLLVRIGDRRILVDTGYGPVEGRPAVGRLISTLAQVGVSPADIDTVVVSHPHGDHIGGATLGAGEAVVPTYPAARYWLGKADWEHFNQADAGARTLLEPKLMPLQRAQRLDLADGEQEIVPGVRLLPLPGHTPGHMGVAFIDGHQTAVYVGDLLHHPLQIDHPEWSPIFDALPPLSRQTRRTLVDRARREGSLILSYHLPFPGIGRVGPGGWDAVSA